MDFHQNIFFYYRGPSKGEGRVERQVENNTTKALINVLEYTNPIVRERFLRWLGVGTTIAGISFDLQKATIGPYRIQRAQQKLLLSIVGGKSSAAVQLPDKAVEGASVPDAWIHNE